MVAVAMSGSPSLQSLPAAELVGIGQLLRQARMQKGLGVEDCARELHLQVRQVQALEQGDFSGFNGPAFVKGYLRACARLYALDGDALVGQYEAAVPSQKPFAPLSPVLATRIVRPSRQSLLNRSLLVVVLLLAAAAGGAGLWWSGIWQPPLPLENPASMDNSPALLPDDQLVATPAVTEPQPSLAPVQAAVPVANPGGQPESEPAAGSDVPLLHVEFMDDCWLQVKDDQGKVLHEKTHRKGDVLDLPAPTPLHLWFGKATAVNVSYNGAVVTVPVKPGFQSARFVIGDDPATGGIE